MLGAALALSMAGGPALAAGVMRREVMRRRSHEPPTRPPRFHPRGERGPTRRLDRPPEPATAPSSGQRPTDVRLAAGRCRRGSAQRCAAFGGASMGGVGVDSSSVLPVRGVWRSGDPYRAHRHGRQRRECACNRTRARPPALRPRRAAAPARRLRRVGRRAHLRPAAAGVRVGPDRPDRLAARHRAGGPLDDRTAPPVDRRAPRRRACGYRC